MLKASISVRCYKDVGKQNLYEMSFCLIRIQATAVKKSGLLSFLFFLIISFISIYFMH